MSRKNIYSESVSFSFFLGGGGGWLGLRTNKQSCKILMQSMFLPKQGTIAAEMYH